MTTNELYMNGKNITGLGGYKQAYLGTILVYDEGSEPEACFLTFDGTSSAEFTQTAAMPFNSFTITMHDVEIQDGGYYFDWQDQGAWWDRLFVHRVSSTQIRIFMRTLSTTRIDVTFDVPAEAGTLDSPHKFEFVRSESKYYTININDVFVGTQEEAQTVQNKPRIIFMDEAVGTVSEITTLGYTWILDSGDIDWEYAEEHPGDTTYALKYNGIESTDWIGNCPE